MSDFSIRLCEALEARHITAAELSRRLGINEGTVSQYKSGAYEPKQRRLQAIAEILNVSIPWLMGADVPMEVKINNITPIESIRKLPVLGKIACGEPILAAEENIEGYIISPTGVKADYVLTCEGDSMIDANIFNGDQVFIKSQPMVENGEIAAVLIGNDTTLKKVYMQDDTLTLIPANSNYEPFVYNKEELNSIKILGKAVAILRSLQ